LTVKFFPDIPSTKYLKGAMLTEIILLPGSFLLPHDINRTRIRKKETLFIGVIFSQDTKITYNLRKGLSINNKFILKEAGIPCPASSENRNEKN
jgi:hypothetical protein